MSMAPPRVSAIIPVFNGSRYLADAIESVLDQTHAAIDITVVDDGSTDESVAVAEWFGDRVRIIRQRNEGQAAALNAGLKSVTGEYVGFLDADDLWMPEKTVRQVEQFTSRPELGYSVTTIRPFLSPELEDRRAMVDPS